MERSEATGVTAVRDRRALAASERTIKRRRRFSLEEKQAILRAAGEPGATVSEVSRQYGVGRSVIHNWRRQEALAVLGATVRFTPVTVEPERRPGGTIEIELGGGVRLRVDAAVNEEALKRVLRALGR
jgi:transposase